jgi:hypothetical protein
MLDRAALWNSVEAIEKRKDAQLAREFDIAIPVELDRDAKVELARKWVGKLTDLGMVVDWACHHLDEKNPHFHAMATMRNIEGEGWGKKNRDWNSPALIDAWRQDWADLCNEALKSHAEQVAKATGVPQEAPTISPLSLKAQGLDRPAQQRIKPSIMGMAKRVGKAFDWARSFVAERRIPPPPPEPKPELVKEPAHDSTFEHLQNLLAATLTAGDWFKSNVYPGPGGVEFSGSDPSRSLWEVFREGLQRIAAPAPRLAGAGGEAGFLPPAAGGGIQFLAERGPRPEMGGILAFAGMVRARPAAAQLDPENRRDQGPADGEAPAPGELLPEFLGERRGLADTPGGGPADMAPGDSASLPRPASQPNPRKKSGPSITR